jgi:hypothetical protein
MVTLTDPVERTPPTGTAPGDVRYFEFFDCVIDGNAIQIALWSSVDTLSQSIERMRSILERIEPGFSRWPQIIAESVLGNGDLLQCLNFHWNTATGTPFNHRATALADSIGVSTLVFDENLSCEVNGFIDITEDEFLSIDLHLESDLTIGPAAINLGD